jgi:hypothetical protein
MTIEHCQWHSLLQKDHSLACQAVIIESRSIRFLSGFPAVDFIGKTTTAKANALCDQTFPLNPCMFTRRSDRAPGPNDPMPGQPCGTVPHGGGNLPWTNTYHAANLSVGQDPTPRYLPDQPVYRTTLYIHVTT